MDNHNDRKSIENWMKKEVISYSALAARLNIPVALIKKWMSQKEIPQEFLSCIQKLMNESQKTKVICLEESRKEGIKLEVSLSDYTRLFKKSRESQCCVGELIARRLDSLSREL